MLRTITLCILLLADATLAGIRPVYADDAGRHLDGLVRVPAGAQ
jgi:hypothetical protein